MESARPSALIDLDLRLMLEPAMGSLGHHCGVSGIHSSTERNLPELLFYMLFSLQHRGQESCGIAWSEGDIWCAKKELGMVAQVLSPYAAERHESRLGIGHVRYSTAGGAGISNAQPLMVSCNKGRIALGHNGNISNGGELRSKLTAEGSIFQGTADSELILHLISRSKATTREEFLPEALGQLEGAYSLVLMHDDALVAARDPSGFRPLYIGTRDDAVFVASETCALQSLGPMSYREVQPGEIVIVDSRGQHSVFIKPMRPTAKCVFELIYFARPDSEIFGKSVHVVRSRLGEALAEQDQGELEADLVVPVPDSGTISAIGYARRSGLPFDFGLARSHYAGRSFILPTKDQRDMAARLKLHAVAPVVEGKRIVLIDDSLVRGTTSRIIVGLLREAGAKAVHLRLAAPELKWPCYYGIDIPDRDQLISNRLDPEGIAREVGADSVRFLSIERLLRAVGEAGGYCCACFDGKHPFPPKTGRKDLA